MIETIGRYEVSLEGGRVLVLYGGNEQEARARVPKRIAAPPSYAKETPCPPVLGIKREGHVTRESFPVDESGMGPADKITFDFGSSHAKLVDDVRKAPGT